MIYFADRDTILYFYRQDDGRQGLAWLLEQQILYTKLREHSTNNFRNTPELVWVLDSDKLDESRECPPFAQVVAKKIIVEAQH